MTQGQQIDARLHPNVRMGGQKRSGLDQAIRAMAVGEADVIAHRQVVDTRRQRALGELVQAARPGAEILLAHDDPHLDRGAGSGPHRLTYAVAARSAVAVDGRLQSEHQSARETSRIRALKDPAGVGAGGEQAGDHVA